MRRVDAVWLAIGVQAACLLPALDRFSAWGDEEFTRRLSAGSLGGALEVLRGDVHPPLFFLLERMLPAEIAWQRLLPVLFACLATYAFDRLWLRDRPERTRVLALWATSPCLLLYAAMARSYTMQVALALVAVAGLWRLREREDVWAWGLGAGGLTALLWTHYLPGFAVAAVALAGGPRCRIAALGAAATLLPWGPQAAEAVQRWWAHGSGYLLSGSSLVEHVPRFAWWALSFTVGESSPGDALPAVALAIPFVGWAALRGARGEPIFVAALAAAVVGYVAVARWASYPFVPARMLFLLPFFVWAVARGLGNVGTVALVALQAVGVVAWMHGDLLNHGYASPHREMAAAMTPCDLVLVDTANSDDTALRALLPESCVVLGVATDEQAEAAREAALGKPAWYWRNTHDLTGGVHSRLTGWLAESHTPTTQTFGHYSHAERLLMGVMGWKNAPDHSFVLERWAPIDGWVVDTAKDAP